MGALALALALALAFVEHHALTNESVGAARWVVAVLVVVRHYAAYSTLAGILAGPTSSRTESSFV